MSDFEESFQKALKAAAGGGDTSKSTGAGRTKLEEAAWDRVTVGHGEGARFVDEQGKRHVHLGSKGMMLLSDASDADLRRELQLPPGASVYIPKPNPDRDFHKEKATLYIQGEFGMSWHKKELTSWFVQKRPYAQYGQAIEMVFKPKGMQKLRRVFITSDKMILASGWGLPDVGDMYGAEQSSEPGVSARMSRHMAFSPEWKSEIAESLKKKGSKILVDLDGYDFYNGRGGHFSPGALA